jgi:triacylglycerol esterase/lipase EstA (alpha/beta hydrolase family)
MKSLVIRSVAAVALLILLVPNAAPAHPGPALATPLAALQSAVQCSGPLAGATRDPVLLVHGTFADSEINWSWNYGLALPARGEPTCTVDLPDKSAGDIQVSTEYVVYAIRTMAAESRRKVAVIGHSQGGLEARWALRWWPDIRRLVSDVIMLGTPNRGALFPDLACPGPSLCAASLYQMQSDSAFLAALNRGRDTAGAVALTSISTTDDVVFVLPQQAVIDGKRNRVTNVTVQDVCPLHVVDHLGLAFDGPTYAIVIDALDHRGPADPSRIDRAVCATDTMPGVDRADAEARVLEYSATLAVLLGPTGPKAEDEPPLACYVTHDRCGH